MFGNIFLGIFTVACLFFFVMLYISSKNKESLFAPIAVYTSLVVTVISFSFALLLSDYNPYDAAFTAEVLKTIQLYSYAVLAILFGVVLSTFAILKRAVKKVR